MDNKKDEKILELVNILKNTKYLVFFWRGWNINR